MSVYDWGWSTPWALCLLLQCMLLPRCVRLMRKCSKLNLTLEQWLRWDILSALGDFNAVTGTERVGYKFCVDPHGSGTRNTSSSLLNFAKSRRLKIAGSWYQRLELHCWTWHRNAGGVAKEIAHNLISTRRILQNCRVFRSAEIFATDHRHIVATFKLHVKSKKICRCDHNVFHLERLKDLTSSWVSSDSLKSVQSAWCP